MRTIMAVALALSAASPAIAADQFDLVCSAPNASVRYRIDLARGEYCAGECKLIQKIQQVTSGAITLFDEKNNVRDARAYGTVNRITGDWEWYNSMFPGAVMNHKGKCRPEQSTGFPVAGRKF